MLSVVPRCLCDPSGSAARVTANRSSGDLHIASTSPSGRACPNGTDEAPAQATGETWRSSAENSPARNPRSLGGIVFRIGKGSRELLSLDCQRLSHRPGEQVSCGGPNRPLLP